MARKAYKGAVAVNALGQLAQGFTQGIAQQKALEQMNAERLIKQQEQGMKEAELRLKLLQSAQGNSAVDPLSGKMISSPGISPDTLRAQFPGRIAPGMFDVGAKSQKVLPAIPRFLNQTVDAQGQVVNQYLLPQGVRPGTTTKPEPQPRLSPTLVNRKSQLQAALSTIDRLQDAFETVKTKGGTGMGLGAVKSFVTAKTQQDPDTTNYNALRDGLTAFVGRNIGGDVGNFAVEEAKAYRSMIPGFISGGDAATARFDSMRNIIRDKLAAVDANAGASAGRAAGPQKIKVTNGKETLLIDPVDETQAAQDGYKRAL